VTVQSLRRNGFSRRAIALCVPVQACRTAINGSSCEWDDWWSFRTIRYEWLTQKRSDWNKAVRDVPGGGAIRSSTRRGSRVKVKHSKLLSFTSGCPSFIIWKALERWPFLPFQDLKLDTLQNWIFVVYLCR